MKKTNTTSKNITKIFNQFRFLSPCQLFFRCQPSSIRSVLLHLESAKLKDVPLRYNGLKSASA